MNGCYIYSCTRKSYKLFKDFGVLHIDGVSFGSPMFLTKVTVWKKETVHRITLRL